MMTWVAKLYKPVDDIIKKGKYGGQMWMGLIFFKIVVAKSQEKPCG